MMNPMIEILSRRKNIGKILVSSPENSPLSQFQLEF